MIGGRVYCLYRVSTKDQLVEDDIPMQREACRQFAQEKGWTIEKEFVEKGISGFKISAKDRDAILDLQEAAKKREFDILLVFMFDRIGRREDETPFVVEWFAEQGIEIWSAKEGQQKFDDHSDKLINYIRFWQAEGESQKTSMRVKTRMNQLVLEGKYRGGGYAFGYKLVKQGRKGKNNVERYDLAIDEDEAIIVKKIFQLALQGYGARKTSQLLAAEGIRNRKGDYFAYGSIQNILKNEIYTGRLKNGETRSDIIPVLQIIDESTFEEVQRIRQCRATPAKNSPSFPRKFSGQAMLSGNVFCGHCGGRMFASTALKNGHATCRERVPVYKCYNRQKGLGLCDGQTTYRAYKIDRVVEQMILNLFEQMKCVNEGEVLSQRYQQERIELEARLKKNKAEYETRKKELAKLDSLILKTLEQQGPFTPEQLARRMSQVEKEAAEFEVAIRQTQSDLDSREEMMARIADEYQKLVSWAEIFEQAPIDTKKLIAAYLVKKVTVHSYEELDIEFGVGEGQLRM